MDTPQPSGTTKRRITLDLGRPLLTWGARPTVTIDGVGHPAQWGTGTWAVADDGSTRIGVSCFNRLWHFGTASGTVGDADGFAYRSSALPLGRGRLTARRTAG
ncbi:hypothetical protein M3666_11955 [Curtobacterium sp. ODYSSEY 48 V2]|uniref:hypothetical protein n=1 Tax=Curtobacterium sp. ODYSSEY 48 V2 TaxID=2939561 RepID=UPI00203B6C92|nr:hypothetical protein [Curtobacterium sp. ODYSSEY 48 V2]MCM3505827.1 hypothetical protein [Curtobacterium sp. ODYSSEY 48 V2]